MDFLNNWGMIAGLAGIGMTVFLILFRSIIQLKIFSKLNTKQSFRLIVLITSMIFTISIFSIVMYSINNASDSPGDITVVVHGKKNRSQKILPNRGMVTLIYRDVIVNETINSKGEAVFKQIPADFFENEAKVEIRFEDPQGEPYAAVYPDSVYTIQRNKYIPLIVELKGLDSLEGIVKDFETGQPINNVAIRVRGGNTTTNEFGEFTLTIPEEHQEPYKNIRALKEGYEPYSENEVPLDTNEELIIKLQKNKL
ncbi:hypothetical protein SAMN04489761_4709 [Tenacibaculum sp. MAR_2009_124]|uniref:carboxypeptidase-like regulatory domain-containing protein n=1 Tax=Tenacibaculum sp. MAR_2009_124 TaxID=1250059 RepID=UPI000895A008|nr:carboxypeptidase-like regulatory domain-containing protein [Tenacibaculum sp. MAR_2009_124]SED23210.1 hypothetical protein SAMN04489761_4709 [Tenacibaculum sp. MAR_2009_124]